MRDVLCRHCWQIYPYKRVAVTCHSEACQGVVRADQRVGSTYFYPFERKGFVRRGEVDLNAACPSCGQTRGLRLACGNSACRHPLDETAGRGDHELLALIGASNAGKTHYLAGLLGSLMENLGTPSLGGTFSSHWTASFADTRSGDSFYRHFFHPLFEEQREIDKTTRDQAEIRILLEGPKSLVLLPFRDYNGELHQRPTGILTAQPMMRYARGLLLMVDPLAYEPARPGSRDALPWMSNGQRPAHELLHDYVNELDRVPLRPGEDAESVRPELKRLAVIVTKADLVLPEDHALQPTAQLNDLESTDFQTRFEERSAQVRSWIEQHLHPRLIAATHRFHEVGYFIASSFGARHEPGTSVHPAPAPVGVVEPLQWLLRATRGKPSRSRSEETSDANEAY